MMMQQHRVILGCLLLAPLPGLALDWRLDYELAIDYQQPGSGPLTLTDTDQAQASRYQQLDVRIREQGFVLKPRLYQPGDEALELSLPEAYLDTRLAGLEWSLGRKSLEWDYGFLSRPLNWLGPDDEQNHNSAETLILAEHYQGLTVWQAACTARMYDADELCLLRVEGFRGAVDWQGLVGHEAGWRLGLGGQWIATDALAMRLTGSWRQNQPQWQWQPGPQQNGLYATNPLQQREGPGMHWNLGATWTSPIELEIMAEHSWHEGGLSQRHWQRLTSHADTLDDAASSDPALAAMNQAWLSMAAAMEPLSEHRTLLRAQYPLDSWRLEALTLLLWTDTTPDRIDQLSLAYTALPLVELEAQWRQYSHHGVLGDLGQRWRFSASMATGQ